MVTGFCVSFPLTVKVRADGSLLTERARQEGLAKRESCALTDGFVIDCNLPLKDGHFDERRCGLRCC